MPPNYYETDRAASEYLLLHYVPCEPEESETFPTRCVTSCLDLGRVPASARALDLGCAVGRSSFELARHCAEVIGIDYSEHFIDLANRLQKSGTLPFRYIEEGELTKPGRAVVPKDINRKPVRFERGDALNLRPDLGQFDVILMANLIDRLANPAVLLKQLPKLMNPGGQLIITSPYTWLLEYTPRKNWLGGFLREGKPVKTFATLRKILSPHFRFTRRLDVPFVIREHTRKFQLGIAEASLWTRR